MYQLRRKMMDHVHHNTTVYLFMVILFLTGIVFGAIIVNSMGFSQRSNLFFYLEQFFKGVVKTDQISTMDIWKDSFFYHAKYLLLLCVLGLSVVGLPLVWVLIFFKGLVVGFSVGFIVNQLGMQGFLLAALSIAPQNLLIIPIYIVAGSMAMIFSLRLLHKLFTTTLSNSIIQPFGRYLVIFATLILLSIVTSGVEAFIGNEGMEAMIKSIYS